MATFDRYLRNTDDSWYVENWVEEVKEVGGAMGKNIKNRDRDVKIAGQVYTIQEMPKGWHGQSNSYGQCDTEKLLIHLATQIPSTRKAETLLHELLHAIYYEYGVNHADDEEATVHILSAGLFQVFKDNPEIVEEILK